MINTNVFINLDNKPQDTKINLNNDVAKKENKVKGDFKEYFNKEVKNNSSKDLTKSNVKETESINNNEPLVTENYNSKEDALTKLSNKLNELLEKENFQGNDLDIESITEILVLISSLLNSNIPNENLPNINMEELGNEDIEKMFLNLFNGQDQVKVNTPLIDINLLSNENKSTSSDFKDLLKEAKVLTDEILENIKSNNLEETSINDYKKELANKILSLLDSLPKESIEKISSNIKDEEKLKVISNLLGVKNDDVEKLNNNSTKVTEVKSDANKTPIVMNVDNEVNKESKDNSNLHDDKDLKQYNFDEASDEDKILSKIIDGDNKNLFSKVLNSYDKFNKSDIEIVKEPVIINKQTLDSDIIKNVKFMMKNAMQELKVKIYPKELGEMTIKILSEEGIMRAEIKATSKETYNLLNSNLQDIKKNLADQNIRIQEVNIGIYNEDTTFFSGKENSSENFKNHQGNENNNRVIFTEEDEEKEDLLNESNVNLLA